MPFGNTSAKPGSACGVTVTGIFETDAPGATLALGIARQLAPALQNVVWPPGTGRNVQRLALGPLVAGKAHQPMPEARQAAAPKPAVQDGDT